MSYDAEIVKLLSTKFVAVAAGTEFDSPAERKYIKSLYRSSSVAYVISPGGVKLSGKTNVWTPTEMKKVLEEGLANYKPEDEAEVLKTLGPREEWGPTLRPPEGGLVIYATWKLLDPNARPQNSDARFTEVWNRMVGVDRVWIRKDEAALLAKGELPERVKMRLATFHPVLGNLQRVDLMLHEGRLSGSVRYGSKSGDQGYEAEVLGFVEAKAGKVVRFDVVARGLWWGDGVEGDGTSAGLTTLPKGKKFPVVVAFTLADPSDGVGRVVPHAALGTSTYLK